MARRGARRSPAGVARSRAASGRGAAAPPRSTRRQKRWFETTGCFLTYYKSKKMTKLLAALNLPQVGEIKLVTDPTAEDAEDKGKLFSIHLNDRDYLRPPGAKKGLPATPPRSLTPPARP